MNFLSHYYFDRDNTKAYEVLGSLLPDLLKNANNSWNIHPEKKDHHYQNPAHSHLLKGWKKHLLVDKIFHNTAFFFFHQHQLKLELREVIKNSPVKPFFLGHIALELILDHLLLTEKKINVDQLYLHLNQISHQDIESFFRLNDLEHTEKFSLFFESFKKDQYLKKYIEVKNISYSLKRICMRLWNNPFTLQQEEEMTKIIEQYISKLRGEFILIFDEIESQLVNE
jgi:hypothetical protein